MISVIMPVYNNGKEEINSAIESIYEQNRNDVEIILINDGSQKAVDISGYPEIILIDHDKNFGAAHARNTGMARAQGDFFAFLDADDCWGPNKLNTQIKLLENAPDDVAGVFNPYYYEGLEEKIYNRNIKHEDWFEYFLTGVRVGPGSTFVVRRSVYEDVGPQDVTLKRLQDWDWLLRIARHYCFVHASGVFSILGRPSRPKKSNALEKSLHLLEEKWLPQLRYNDRRKFQATIAIERGAEALRNGQKMEMMNQVLNALVLSPKVLHHNLMWKYNQR